MFRKTVDARAGRHYAIDRGRIFACRIVTPVEGLAVRMVVTSDDQNMQRLARDLRAMLPTLVEAIPAKADHP